MAFLLFTLNILFCTLVCMNKDAICSSPVKNIFSNLLFKMSKKTTKSRMEILKTWDTCVIIDYNDSALYKVSSFYLT